MTNQRACCYRFDDICVDAANFRVSKAGTVLPLEPKTFLVLLYLIEHRDRLVEKRELLDAIWKDVAVTENALTREIAKLRKSLADDPKAAKYIQTVHTRGYRFIGDVQETEEGAILVQSESGAAADSPAKASASGERKHVSKWVLYKTFVALSVAVLLAASGFYLRQSTESPKTPPVKRQTTSLAVLPFRSLNGAKDDKNVGLGIADALITKLSNSAQLEVEPVSTVLHYADPAVDSVAMGRAMHVDYVLEGKFQHKGDRFRVTVQLLCISCNGGSRWAASFDEVSKDVFQIQDSISQKVSAALPLQLSREEQKMLAKRGTSDLEAQAAVGVGKFHLNEDTRESLEKAIEYFHLAATRDPKFAAPWTLLADGYRRRGLYGVPVSQFVPLVRQAIAHARDLDDTDAYTHSMLGLVAFQFDWDFSTAAREYTRARELQPLWMHQWYFRYLLATNRAAEAESGYAEFSRLVPFSTFGKTNFAEFLFLTGQYRRALQASREIIEMRPDYAPAHEVLGLVYEQEALPDLAVQEFQKAIQLSGGFHGLAALGHLYAVAGSHTELQSVLGQIDAQRKQRYIAPFDLAVIHAGMGENAKALADLEQAYADRSLSAQSLRFDPRLNRVRMEPGYRQFLKRIGLE